MAGLMTPQPADAGAPPPAPAAPAPAPQPGGQQPQQSGPPIADGPVDPEMQKKFIANCMDTVTSTLSQITKMVQDDQDKVDALAHSAVIVVIRVEDSFEKSGGTLSLSMTFNAGAETITDIAEAMDQAGAYTYQDKEIQAAFLKAVDMYRMARQQQGRLDPAMFQQKIAQLKQAEANGTLEKDYPGLAEFAAKNKPQAQKPPYQPQGQDDGDGQDQEDAGDQQQDDGGDEPAAASAQPPAPPAKAKPESNNFPAKMLKKKGKPAAKPKAKGKGR